MNYNWNMAALEVMQITYWATVVCMCASTIKVVSSPDPTLSQREMVWWTKSNFLAHAFATM